MAQKQLAGREEVGKPRITRILCFAQTQAKGARTDLVSGAASDAYGGTLSVSVQALGTTITPVALTKGDTVPFIGDIVMESTPGTPMMEVR